MREAGEGNEVEPTAGNENKAQDGKPRLLVHGDNKYSLAYENAISIIQSHLCCSAILAVATLPYGQLYHPSIQVRGLWPCLLWSMGIFHEFKDEACAVTRCGWRSMVVLVYFG